MTCDGRFIIGTLEGYDQATNLIIRDARERVFSATDGFKEVPLGGIFGIRGDNVAMVAEVDEDLDSQIDYESTRCNPPAPIWPAQ
ncbi:hypothetical protein FO519_005073 [Halicephalobus sp. NKZ332]|nr:hypothetical protein FO519_005073 [Halicephalobus sp. NKZ332]